LNTIGIIKIIEIILTILTFGIYLFGLHLARYYWITKPTHALLEAQIDGIRCRIKIEKDQPERNQPERENPRDKAIIKAIEDLLDIAEDKAGDKKEPS